MARWPHSRLLSSHFTSLSSSSRRLAGRDTTLRPHYPLNLKRKRGPSPKLFSIRIPPPGLSTKMPDLSRCTSKAPRRYTLPRKTRDGCPPSTNHNTTGRRRQGGSRNRHLPSNLNRSQNRRHPQILWTSH